MNVKNKSLEIIAFTGGLVFFAPVALLVRTQAGVSTSMFFVLQAILSLSIFLLEIPTGKFSDRVGYKNTIILSEVTLCLARLLLFLAYLFKSVPLFVAEVLLEGLSACFASGTTSAYLYSVAGEEQFASRSAHLGNCGTVGFVISTILYMPMYYFWDMEGLLIATIIAGIIGVFASFGLEKERQAIPSEEEQQVSARNFIKGICNGKTFMIIMLSSCISIAYILINFFYVDKLQQINLNEMYLTPIILGYSIIQLLAEWILRRVEKQFHKTVFMITFLLAGGSMLWFGWSSNVIVVILLMLILPLLLDIPSYILDAVQNKYVDQLQQEEKRAELLSVFSMGVNLVEILFLFLSAAITDAGASLCYCVVGLLLLLLGMLSRRSFREKE